MVRSSELPLEMGDVRPGVDPDTVVIGICHRCARRGLLLKSTRNCTGWRAVTAKNGIVQVPQERSLTCFSIAMRRMSKSNRKLLQRAEAEPIKLPRKEIV